MWSEGNTRHSMVNQLVAWLYYHQLMERCELKQARKIRSPYNDIATQVVQYDVLDKNPGILVVIRYDNLERRIFG